MHSFRHSMLDRLSAVECPSDIIDQIGGWSASSSGEMYGKGFPIAVLRKWLITRALRNMERPSTGGGGTGPVPERQDGPGCGTAPAALASRARRTRETV